MSCYATVCANTMLCTNNQCGNYATYQSKPSAAIHNMENLDLQPDLLICDPCKKAISACRTCRYINSSLSLRDIRHLEIMRQNMSLVNCDDGTFKIQVHYPQLKDPKEVFHPKNAKPEQVKAASIRLRNKLLKLGLLEHYDRLIKQAIDDNHLRLVEEENVMTEPVNFIPLNYTEKDSTSTPVRPVTNGSYENKIGVSLNSNCIPSPTMLGNGIQTILGFRSHNIGFNADVSKFYRCILTSQLTNQLRRIFWFSDINDPSSLRCLEFTRGQFGDCIISAYSEMALLDFVAPQCQTDELRLAITEHRVVDDIASSCADSDILSDIKNDMETTFKKFGFSLKHFLYSKMPLDTGQSPIEKVLGVVWDLSKDSLSSNVVFNAHEKKRGKYSGGPLTVDQCHSMPISKTVLARFAGQCHEYCGVLICPIQSSLRIAFSEACVLLEDWHLPLHLVDEQVDQKIRSLMKNLVDVKNRIEPIPRCFAYSSIIRRIYVSSDASQSCLGYTIHVLSVDSEGNPQSHLILARSSVHHMTIPHGEITALTKAVKGMNEILSMSKFIADTPDLQIIFCLDSLCGAHSLAPSKIHTDVRVRNCSHSIHRILSDIVHSKPNITISMVHITSANNSADVVSRGSSDPCIEANSNLYRNGPDLFLDPQFPSSESVFLSFVHGSGAIFSYPRAQQEILESNINANCTKCNFSYNFCHDRPRNWTPNETQSVIKLYYNTNGDAHVNILELNLYKQIITECRTMAKAINVLIALFSVVKRLKSKSRKELHHLSFLTLAKSSQYYFPSRSVKSAQLFSDDFGLLRAVTRLDGETAGILDVDESPVVISTTDKRLLHLLIDDAHTSPSGVLSKQHLGPVLTTARLLQKPYPVYVPHANKSVKAFIKHCALCNHVKSTPFLGRMSSPRWVRSVRSDNLVFAHLSVDTVGPFSRIAFPGSKRTVKFYVLAILCHFTKAITFQVMENNTRESVTLALFVHSCTYRKPDLVFADAGTSQVPKVGSQEYVKYFGSHPMECNQYEASHQKLNQVERFIGEMKKILKTVFLQRDRLKLPHLTHPQLLGILGAVQDVMNSRPIFGTDTFVSANHFLKPFLIGQSEELQHENFQLRLDQLRDAVGSAHKHFVSILKHAFLYDKSRILQSRKHYNFQNNDICLLFRADRYTLVKIIQVGKFYSKIVMPGSVPKESRVIHNSKLVFISREQNEVT